MLVESAYVVEASCAVLLVATVTRVRSRVGAHLFEAPAEASATASPSLGTPGTPIAGNGETGPRSPKHAIATLGLTFQDLTIPIAPQVGSASRTGMVCATSESFHGSDRVVSGVIERASLDEQDGSHR
ncbi:MAG: hypothetical protein ABI321_21140 [Polyangia bacterium]